MNRFEPPPSGTRPAMPDFRVSDIGFAIGRWFWEFWLVFLLIIVCGLVYIGIMREPAFESSARLYVRLSQEQAPPETLFAQPGTTFLTESTGDVVSEIDLLLNSAIMQRVIERANMIEAMQAPPPPPVGLVARVRRTISDAFEPVSELAGKVLVKLGLKTELPIEEAALRQLQSSIRVQRSLGSQVISLGFVWPQRDVPQPLLEMFIAEYFAYRNEIFRSDQSSYFADQLERVAADIDEINARIMQMRRSDRIHDLGAQRVALIDARHEAQTDLESHLTRSDVVASRLDEISALDLSALGGHVVQVGLRDPEVFADLDRKALDLISELGILADRDARAAPSRRQALESEYRELVEAMLSALRSYLNILDMEIDTATERLDRISAELDHLAGLEADWNAALRDLSLAETRYAFFQSRLDEMASIEDLRNARISNVLVLQEPSPPVLSAGLRNSMLMAAIGVAAAIFAVAWIVLREFFDDKVHREVDLKRAGGASVLGRVARVRSRTHDPDIARVAARLLHVSRIRGCSVVMAAPEIPIQHALEEVLALAAALDAQSGLPVLVLDLTGARTPPPAKVTLLEPNDLARQGEGAPPSGVSLVQAGDDVGRCLLLETLERSDGASLAPWGATLVAAQPPGLAPETLRAVMATQRVVFTVAAGRETRTALRRAAAETRDIGARVLGLILMQHKRVVPRFLGGRE